MRPLGVHKDGIIGAIAGGPEQQEAEPARVERQVFQAPLFTFGHLLVIDRVLKHPWR